MPCDDTGTSPRRGTKEHVRVYHSGSFHRSGTFRGVQDALRTCRQNKSSSKRMATAPKPPRHQHKTARQCRRTLEDKGRRSALYSNGTTVTRKQHQWIDIMRTEQPVEMLTEHADKLLETYTTGLHPAQSGSAQARRCNQPDT